MKEFIQSPYDYSKYKKEIEVLEQRKRQRIRNETIKLKSKVIDPIDHVKYNTWNVQPGPNLTLCDHNKRLQTFVKERRLMIKSDNEKQQLLNFHKWDLIKARREVMLSELNALKSLIDSRKKVIAHIIVLGKLKACMK